MNAPTSAPASGSPILDQSVPVRTIMVGGTTSPKGLAGSIMEEFRQAGKKAQVDQERPRYPNISLHAIGHQAVGQAFKAVPIVNGLLGPKGLQLVIYPSFEDHEIGSDEDPNVKVVRTVMCMRLLPWTLGG